jgi:hypothetical protein
MTVSKERLARSVHIVEDKWWSIIARTGDLTFEDMVRTLRSAYARGEDVVVPGNESSLSVLWMNWYFIGDEEVDTVAFYG